MQTNNHFLLLVCSYITKNVVKTMIETYLAALTKFHDSLLSLYLLRLYANLIQNGMNITTQSYVFKPGHMFESWAEGIEELNQSPFMKKQPVAPRSFNGFTKLVKISATKKCLKVTTVKGEMKTSDKVFSISNLAVRQKKWKGIKQRATMIIRALRVKAAMG